MWLIKLRTQPVSMRMQVWSLVLLSCIASSCSIDFRCILDLAWLWLWLWPRLAPAAPFQPLAQEFPYAAGMTMKRKKKKCHSASLVSNSQLSALLMFLLPHDGSRISGWQMARPEFQSSPSKSSSYTLSGNQVLCKYVHMHAINSLT